MNWGLNQKLTSFQRLNFTLSTILPQLMENNVIRAGGSGNVYQVAIYIRCICCRLEKEFLAEVEILGTIKHNNIVNLVLYLS